MKVVLYAPNYLPATRYGGPVRSAYGLATGLACLGHNVEVFTTDVDGPDRLRVPLGEPVLVAGVEVQYHPVTPPRRMYRSRSMARALARSIPSASVVHTNGMFLWPGPAAARLAISHHVPLVISPRGMLQAQMIAGRSAFVKRAWIALLERRCLQHASAIHATSEDEADGIRKLGLDLAPIEVVPNGVDLPVQMPTEEEVESVWRDIPRGSRVAFLGRLDWTKGVELAVESVVATANAHLLVAGPDQIGLRKELEERLSQTPHRGRCRFLGAVDGTRKWALLIGADIVLVPSLRESFGIVVAEALAVGTPVICTPGVGAAPLVAELDSGCVISRERDALSRAIERLLSEPQRRAHIGARARHMIASSYTWAAVSQKMAALYERVSHTSRERDGWRT